MPLWAPDAEAVAFENKVDKKNATTSCAPPPNPEQDAARMAALKRLRHRLIKLCSAADSKAKPPVLAFERWMARAALTRRPDIDDCLIPSNGDAVDRGLIKDLCRTLAYAASKTVAETLTTEACEAAKRVAKVGTTIDTETKHNNSTADASDHKKSIRKDIKHDTKTVKEAAKLVEKLLKSNEDNEDDDLQEPEKSEIGKALCALRAATMKLNQSSRKAQHAIGCIPEGDDDDDNADSNKNSPGSIHMDGSRRPGVFDISFFGPEGKPKRPYLTISASHLTKLLRLWILQKQEGEEENEKDNDKLSKKKRVQDYRSPMEGIQAMSATERKAFSKTVYCCLARYEALKGAGYQCAVPGVAFDAAAACGLGTTIECFASPLNCRYRKYCSAFPDVETHFGSIGSFFDDNAFNPMEGSFEANPPFVPETMFAMGEKIERLLGDSSRGALSFLVVIPAWGAGIQFCEDLEASQHVRAATRIPASDHAFCDGAQHTRPISGKRRDPDMRPSSWDTAVILLQNKAGAKRWPVTMELLDSTFCEALKSTSKVMPKEIGTISGWERRGIGRGGSTKKRPNNTNSNQQEDSDRKPSFAKRTKMER